MQFTTLTNKKTIVKNSTLQKDMVDLTINLDGSLKPEFLHTVFKHEEMRPDLISISYYNTPKYADIILKFNGISNPFSIKEDDILHIPYLIDITAAVKKSQKSKNKPKDQFINKKKMSEADKKRLEYLKSLNTKKASAENLPPNMLKDNEAGITRKDGESTLGLSGKKSNALTVNFEKLGDLLRGKKIKTNNEQDLILFNGIIAPVGSPSGNPPPVLSNPYTDAGGNVWIWNPEPPPGRWGLSSLGDVVFVEKNRGSNDEIVLPKGTRGSSGSAGDTSNETESDCEDTKNDTSIELNTCDGDTLIIKGSDLDNIAEKLACIKENKTYMDDALQSVLDTHPDCFVSYSASNELFRSTSNATDYLVKAEDIDAETVANFCDKNAGR